MLRIFGHEYDELVASEHRSAWAPIFYPESLLLGASGRETHIDEKIFIYPANQGFAQFMHELELTLEEGAPKYPINLDDDLPINLNCLFGDEKAVFFGSPKKIRKMETFDSRVCGGKTVYIEAKTGHKGKSCDKSDHRILRKFGKMGICYRMSSEERKAAPAHWLSHSMKKYYTGHCEK